MTGKSRYLTLYRYISNEFLFTFIVAFLFFFAIFFVNQLLVIAKNILIANVRLTDVLKIILYSIPVILSFTFPFASLTGAAMSIGQLSSRNELLAFRSGGISLMRILVPVIGISLIFSGFSFLLNDIFLPLGTIKYKELYRELIFRNPSLELKSNTITRLGNTFFITGDITENEVDNLIIIDVSPSGLSTIVSQNSRISQSEAKSESMKIELESISGFIAQGGAVEDYDSFHADEMEYILSLGGVSRSFMSLTPNDMSIRDVANEIGEMEEKLQVEQGEVERQAGTRTQRAAAIYREAADSGESFKLSQRVYQDAVNLENKVVENRKLRYYKVEFYKKTALPAACTALVFFAFPLSAFRLKNGRVVGFGIGVISSTFYWFLLLAAQTSSSRIELSPALLMWFPNLLFGGIGVVLLIMSMRGRRG